MVIILFIAIFVLFCTSFLFRQILFNPWKSIKFGFFDLLKYFKYKDIPKNPFINCYVGLFGQGKTLSAVHDVIEFYRKYNNKKVWDDRYGRWAIQKVYVLSNVDLTTIPYRRFHSLDQLQFISKYRHVTDKKYHTRTITICLIDECSVCFNSRSFKTFPVPFIRTLLTSRHALIHGFYLTSQRFGHMDALLRQVTSNVVECHKEWRFVRNVYYDAWKYENCSNPLDMMPEKKEVFFADDKLFKSYDTLQVVEDLNKIIEEKDFQDDKIILENQGQSVKCILDRTEKKKKRRK